MRFEYFVFLMNKIGKSDTFNYLKIQKFVLTRPSKQCKSLVDVLMLRQYLEKEFFCGEEEKRRRTRLTYNCAHLRSTKESLILEYDI